MTVYPFVTLSRLLEPFCIALHPIFRTTMNVNSEPNTGYYNAWNI